MPIFDLALCSLTASQSNSEKDGCRYVLQALTKDEVFLFSFGERTVAAHLIGLPSKRIAS
jgi:hypothetical protein